MRTAKELLVLLDREIDGGYFKSGLCALIGALLIYEIIDCYEYYELDSYIHVNNPHAIGMNGWDNKRLSERLFWWPQGDKEPRHEYMKILIENCDEN